MYVCVNKSKNLEYYGRGDKQWSTSTKQVLLCSQQNNHDKKIKDREHKTIVRQVLVYGAEIWAISRKTERKLNVTDNKIYHQIKIFGGVKEGEVWK